MGQEGKGAAECAHALICGSKHAPRTCGECEGEEEIPVDAILRVRLVVVHGAHEKQPCSPDG